MSNTLMRAFVVMYVGTALLAPGAQAEPETAVRAIPDEKLTSDELIRVLTPPSATRGIDASAEGKAPNCEELRKRGIDAASVADVAAIKVMFAFNSAELTPSAAENLNKLGQALKSSELAPYCFRIEGHTDAVGSDEYNQALSERRANAVVRYLAGHFSVEADHLIPVGYGEKKPATTNETDEGRQQNRRVQIANLGDGTPE